jgi:uncharacterized membrane protein
MKKKEEIKSKNNFDEHPIFKSPRTFGQRAADALTGFAGSWTFIIILFTILILWIIVNAIFLVRYELGNPFDPYPFILLNLGLSCLAAVQAPIILMSQNREAQKDRLRAQYDYAVNKKAEKEIEEIKNILLRKRK